MATLAQLKTLAKDLKIKGYSSMKKDDLAAAIDKVYKAMDGAGRIDPAKRIATYKAQRNGGLLSFRQNRRVKKAENKAKS